MNWANLLRTRLLPRRSPVEAVVQLVMLVLIVLLALQSARLLWAVLAPIGPVGRIQNQVRNTQNVANPAFDPFFRLSAQNGSIIITALPLKLYGTRVDSASGRGSAIIATPDGIQSSYAIGDIIMPGVTLKQVNGDSAMISRSGTDEQIFIDQSVPVTTAVPVASRP